MLMSNVCLLISLDLNLMNATSLVPKETKGYYFYYPTENKKFVAHSDVFHEREFLSKKNSGSKVQLEEVRETHDVVSSS